LNRFIDTVHVDARIIGNLAEASRFAASRDRLSADDLAAWTFLPATRQLVEQVSSVLSGRIIRLSLDAADIAEAKNAVLALTAAAGEAVQVEAGKNTFWYSLGVAPDASPVAADGVGANPLHIDMMTFSRFPNAMAIMCERTDPNGGGATLLAAIAEATERLSAEDRYALSAPAFSYWMDEDLINVGHHLEQFPVLPGEPGGRVRFSSKLPDRIAKTPSLSCQAEKSLPAIHRFVASLERSAIRVMLAPYDVILYSQFHYCHGRSELGQGQANLDPGSRRQLWRLYFNAAGTIMRSD
jgi:hypothetical protein